jgi:hypothetical protein
MLSVASGLSQRGVGDDGNEDGSLSYRQWKGRWRRCTSRPTYGGDARRKGEALHEEWQMLQMSFLSAVPALTCHEATASVALWSEFLAASPELPGSIPGATAFSEK